MPKINACLCLCEHSKNAPDSLFYNENRGVGHLKIYANSVKKLMISFDLFSLFSLEAKPKAPRVNGHPVHGTKVKTEEQTIAPARNVRAVQVAEGLGVGAKLARVERVGLHAAPLDALRLRLRVVAHRHERRA